MLMLEMDPARAKGIFIHLILFFLSFPSLFIEVSIPQAFLLAPLSLQPWGLNISGC